MKFASGGFIIRSLKRANLAYLDASKNKKVEILAFCQNDKTRGKKDKQAYELSIPAFQRCLRAK